MKKMIFSTLALLLLSVFVTAQSTYPVKVNNTFLVFTAGPAFPVSDFASSDLSNTDAGMAKNGYNIEFKLGHHFDKVFGFAATVSYGSNQVDKSFVNNAPGVKIDPWHYYALMVGPMITGTLTPKTSFDFNVLTGAAYVNSPRVKLDNEVIATDDWAATVPVKLAADFRFQFNSRGYLFTGANYLYMRPHFDASLGLGEIQRLAFKQKMSVIGINAGLGFRF
jgi:opacity protein-like surface antigen